jgi:hypothetical protein
MLCGFDENQLRLMVGGTAAAMADGTPLPEPTKPLGPDTYDQPMQLARIHQYLSMATPLIWTSQADTVGVLGLAINVCAERNGYAEEVDRIRELLETARDLWVTWGGVEAAGGRTPAGRLTFRLIHLADIEAVTAPA